MSQKKYWIVWDETNKTGVPVRHITIGSAKEAAREMAGENPTHRFVVMGAEFAYSVPTLKVESEPYQEGD